MAAFAGKVAWREIPDPQVTSAGLGPMARQFVIDAFSNNLC
jgi:hypothetical protein